MSGIVEIEKAFCNNNCKRILNLHAQNQSLKIYKAASSQDGDIGRHGQPLHSTTLNYN